MVDIDLFELSLNGLHQDSSFLLPPSFPSLLLLLPLPLLPHFYLPLRLQVYDTKAKPTYLKAPSDGVVTALGLGGLSLVFLRTMTGFGDMALGTNKVEIQ